MKRKIISIGNSCHFLAVVLMILISFCVSACSSDKEEDVKEDPAKDLAEYMVKDLSEILNIDASGQCPFLKDRVNGEYFFGVENINDAKLATTNLSLGASLEKGNKLTLPANHGTITVLQEAAEGHYFDITYNVKGINVQKICVVNNNWLKNENSESSDNTPEWHCNDCNRNLGKASNLTKCVFCKSLNVGR